MNPPILAILSLHVDTPIGPWSASTFGDAANGCTIQHPQHARVEFSVDHATGTWVSRVFALGSAPVTVKVDAAWKPFGELAGPTRIVEATDMSNAARVITRDGGVTTGQRIDAASPEAFFRDRFTIQLLPGQKLEISASIEPCAPSDLDGDGSVGAGDAAITLGAWGATSLAADINKDGIVDAKDLARVLADYERPASDEVLAGAQPSGEPQAEEPSTTSAQDGVGAGG